MRADNCKIGYEVAYKGQRVLCTGRAKDTTRFKHSKGNLYLKGSEEVHLPSIMVGIKVVETHEGLEASTFIPFYGKVYAPWEDLK